MADGFLGIAINIDGEWSTLIRPVWISIPKTWLESSCQAPNHLYAPAILRSKCWYPPTAPRALKKGPLSNLHLLSNQKKHINKNSESTDSDGFEPSPDFKTQIRLSTQIPKDLVGRPSSQILTKLCETIQYTETPRPKVDQTTIIDLRCWGFRPPSRKWIPLNHGDHAEPPNALAWSHSHTSTHGVNCVSCGKYHCFSADLFNTGNQKLHMWWEVVSCQWASDYEYTIPMMALLP